ncbi:DUF421 domain-containing protein [Sphingobacterium sp. lm-10]|uniref:DUF421 domain-containing protein n=1 Tax=Sphingobacterium sp. lm-10 TaxID=2944904 RepID=UPI002020BC30|nr:YetF domain-containing protein [Sphingobacterium sp. lm-10]MCL7986651.1 DUF421 domain-containing protein [Sphingobacterium sp. lm-10]
MQNHLLNATEMMAFFEKVFLHNLDFSYAFEIVFRTTIMFAIIITFLRLTGKKGIRQLSIYEVAIIIALGSAAGDPMIVEDMAIVPSLIAFVSTLLLYRLITYISARHTKVESLIEGQPLYVIEDGMFSLEAKKAHTLGEDEFFAEMREANVSHIGQIKTAILETNGKLSIFYFEDKLVKYGLPILPREYKNRTDEIEIEGHYACTNCGAIEYLTNNSVCKRCNNTYWLRASNDRRIT